MTIFLILNYYIRSKLTPIKVNNILDVETSEEEVGGDEDEGEVRIVINSDHDSNSCLEYSSFEDSRDDDNIQFEYFIGKDKTTKWSKTPLTNKFTKNKYHKYITRLKIAKETQDEVRAFQIIFLN